MVRTLIAFLLALSCTSSWAQQFSVGLGVFTGITSPFTLDKGIDIDPRYTERYSIKYAPIGVSLGVDYEGFGLIATPGIVNLGQEFYMVNTSGGQDGRRTIDLRYLSIPVAFKVHIIRLSFFKVSGLVSLAPAYLLSGNEVVTHSASKMYFSPEVYPILPADYIVEYDGVVVPDVEEYTVSGQSDFKSLQLFAAAGFRSDWDVTDHWRVSVDFRLNYGIYDPRSDDYLARLGSFQELYALPGKRQDLFAQLTIGIARFIDLEKRDREQKKRLKGSSRQYKTSQYPYAKPRNKKPKG
jgi:hypothetical protein